MARLSTSLVFGAVWPTYWPTRSSRVTLTSCPVRRYPSSLSSSPMCVASVVFPVPGLPVKHICRLGRDDARPKPCLSRSTSNSAAISRTRSLTGASPTKSSLSRSSNLDMRRACSCELRSTLASAGSGAGSTPRSSGSAAGPLSPGRGMANPRGAGWAGVPISRPAPRSVPKSLLHNDRPVAGRRRRGAACTGPGGPRTPAGPAGTRVRPRACPR